MDIEAPGIGHNAPPPVVVICGRIADLCEAAGYWLDGTPIATAAQAADVAQLVSELRAAANEADKAREAAKAPHLSASRAVDAEWKPLIDKAGRAKNAALAAQTTWLAKQEAERLERERQDREAARIADEAARRLHVEAAPTNLAALEAADSALQQAKAADAQLRQTRTDKPVARGHDGARGITLRSKPVAVLVDIAAACAYYAEQQPELLCDLLTRLGNSDARQGKRDIPGFRIDTVQAAQ
jgi:hypothetical protein